MIMMNRFNYTFFIGALVILLCACSSDYKEEQNDVESDRRQTFYVAVESEGELFTVNEDPLGSVSRRPITSVTPKQTFDRLTLIVFENAVPAKVVYRKDFYNWSSTDNKTSIPWSNDEGQGRYAEVVLNGSECLNDGKSYMAYAVGYQSGTYSDYEPFSGVKVGDDFFHTEVVDAPVGVIVEEIFAGAGILEVIDGKIMTKLYTDSDYSDGLVILRRQVAGTFGFFTNIPAMIGDTPVAGLRLVSTARNRTAILGGFRSIDDPQNFIKENVVNGMTPLSDYDTFLYGAEKKNAFTVYEIDLSRWFPGNNENPLLPLDENGDGFLGPDDLNWQLDNERYPEGTVSLPRGTVFGDSFMVPLLMTKDDVAKDIPTFQMQLVGCDDRILKYWNVVLRDVEDNSESRTLVTLPDGVEGRTKVEVVDNFDTATCFSIIRNRLYTMGEKNLSQNYGEDEPLDLGNAEILVLDARHEWRIFDTVIFD